MKLTILGVLVIFLAQSGFIAYTAIERQSDEVVAANGVPAGNDPVTDAPYILTDLDSPATGVEQAPVVVNNGSVALLAVERHKFRRPVESQFLTAKKARRLVISTTANFKPQVIMIPKSPRTEFPAAEPTDIKYSESQAYYRPVAPIEQRSFASKTLSVIKKPYDWLKFLGSKMR